MLDPWIIEEILRREQDRQEEQDRGRARIPVEPPHYREGDRSKPTSHDDDSRRGVIVIDI